MRPDAGRLWRQRNVPRTPPPTDYFAVGTPYLNAAGAADLYQYDDLPVAFDGMCGPA
jgi:hypothetical protein